MLRKAHELYGKPRPTLLERRLKNEMPENAASDDGTGAVIHVDVTDLIVGDLSTTTYLEEILDTGLQRLLAVKVRRPARCISVCVPGCAPLLLFLLFHPSRGPAVAVQLGCDRFLLISTLQSAPPFSSPHSPLLPPPLDYHLPGQAAAQRCAAGSPQPVGSDNQVARTAAAQAHFLRRAGQKVPVHDARL